MKNLYAEVFNGKSDTYLASISWELQIVVHGEKLQNVQKENVAVDSPWDIAIISKWIIWATRANKKQGFPLAYGDRKWSTKEEK